jgi:hypothetical protein
MCSFSTIKYYLLTGLNARHFGGVLDDTVEGKGNLTGGKISFPGLRVGSLVSDSPMCFSRYAMDSEDAIFSLGLDLL